jgi:hypothetical protein
LLKYSGWQREILESAMPDWAAVMQSRRKRFQSVDAHKNKASKKRMGQNGRMQAQNDFIAIRLLGYSRLIE